MNLERVHASAEDVDDFAEEFIFGRLRVEELRVYEEHLLTCEICRGAVDKAEALIRDLRNATGEEPVN